MPHEDDLQSQHSLEGKDDVSYLLGWFCGGIPVLGVIVAAVYLAQGRRRPALQALVLPLGVIFWLFFIMDGLRPMLPKTEAGSATWVLLLLAGILLIPIFELRWLRASPWPAAAKT